MDAAGTIHRSPKGSPEAVALCGGIGLIGAVTEFKLQVTPSSNTLLSTWYIRNDDNIVEDINKMLSVGVWGGNRASWTREAGGPAPGGGCGKGRAGRLWRGAGPGHGRRARVLSELVLLSPLAVGSCPVHGRAVPLARARGASPTDADSPHPDNRRSPPTSW